MVNVIRQAVAVAVGLVLAAPVALAKPTEPARQVELAPTAQQAEAAMWAMRYLTRYHYKRMPLDDAMSAKILDGYLDSLDGDRLFFTAADIERFDVWKDGLDDAIYAQDLKPPYEIFDVYVERVAERTAHARGLLKQGFDFSVDESLPINRDDPPWAADTAALDDLWRKRVKNDWLRLRLNGKADDEIVKTLDKRYARFEDRVRELDGEDIFQTFMNAYATAIEPHTAYLAPRSAENFAMQMRLSLEGIGAVLMREDEFTVVRSIVKGGPASQQGQLKVGDRISAVGQGDKGPMQDVIGWRVDDVVDLIRGPKGTTVTLDVLPADAPVDAKPVHIAIERDTVKLEQQAAKKTIIELPDGDTTRRIGVIMLPAFYHDFEGQRRGDPDFRSSTRDVARLIGELKAERVEGIVLDLRDNGGGSLTEATNLTGLFIPTGPVVQVRDAQGRISVESDRDPNVLWDGPLAVMVNRTSASASEILAAALQDYGRALIVGQNTYGKGTVQNMLDLDQVTQSDEPRFGQVKLTIAQFFRVNGGSTQNRGVAPDIVFPSKIDEEVWGESAIDNALPWTSITPAEFKVRGSLGELVPLLETRHAARVADDREFRYWVEDVEEMRKLSAQTEISLREADRKAERDRQAAKREARRAEREQELAASDAAEQAEADELDDGLLADERPIDGSEDEDEDIKPDALMRETAHILADSIELLSTDRALAARTRSFNLVSALAGSTAAASGAD
jgi:carboxyl-terminal processing protease